MENNKILEKYEKYAAFYTLYTIWFVFIAFHFYYLVFKLGDNGMINISSLMSVFKIKMIIDYIWMVVLPIVNYFLIYKIVFFKKTLLENESKQLKLTFNGLGVLFLMGLFFTVIF